MDSTRAAEFAGQLAELLQTQQSDKLLLFQERQILEQIYKELTKTAAASFHGLFARMQYYHDQEGTPEAIVHQLNTLRILCNKVAHDELDRIPDGAVKSGVLSIYTLLRHIDPSLVNGDLDVMLEAATTFARRQESRKSSFQCLLLDWKYQESAGKKTALELYARTDEGREITIVLRDDQKNSKRPRFTMLYPGLWKYAELGCHQLSEVAGKENYYIDNQHTLIVLEPDFLIDASAVAECMDTDSSHPELFVLSKLFAEPSSAKMLMGQMVNSMFDALIHNPDLDYRELFTHALNSSPIPMVALGAGTALEIYRTIESGHLPQLRLFAQQMKDVDLLLEPSYLCPKYGLQGRLDLLYRDKKKFSIVELKSGKAHPTDVWPQQIFQVVAYNMIIRNAYGAEALGSSSILYSSAGDKYLRNVSNIPILEQQLIHCRNRIVSTMRLLSQKPERFFDWLIRQSPDAYSPFVGEKLKRLQLLRKSIADHEYEWFLEQVIRLTREIWQVKLGSLSPDEEQYYGHNALWQLNPDQKTGKIIRDLRVTQCEGQIIMLELPPQSDVTDFRSGDIVIFYDLSRPLDKQEIIRGVIKNMDEQQINLRIRAGVKNERRFGDAAKWALEHDTLETFLYAPFSSLSSFLEAESAKRDLLLGITEPAFLKAPSPGEEMADVLDRMHKTADLHIVQGPPGTGKTSGLLSAYIEDFYRISNKHMMVLSFTNRAVDEICLCLQKRGIPFIRTGNSQALEADTLEAAIRGKRFAGMEDLIRNNRIFVSTVQSANAYYRDLSSIIEIDEMIVDEASQILEPSLLGLLSGTKKCILIGDQNQLPAITTQSPSPYQFTHQSLRDLQYGSINQSLMERLFRRYESQGWHSHKDMLKAHYRMHDEIAELVSHYYNGQLCSVRESQKADLKEVQGTSVMRGRLIWIECPISTEDYYDPLQVEIVASIVAEYGDTKPDLGVVAPYRAMIHALRKKTPGISIDTVERYQGSERETMILCLPFRKLASLKHMQSLSDDGKVDRKLNVAISRAKERLIVIGNSNLCRQTRHYQQLYENIRSRGQIINYQELGVNHGKSSTSESA